MPFLFEFTGFVRAVNVDVPSKGEIDVCRIYSALVLREIEQS
jgi:hypothetical protein